MARTSSFRLVAIAAATLTASCASLGSSDPGDDRADPVPGLDGLPRVDRAERTADGLPYYLRGDLGHSAAIRDRDVGGAATALAPVLPAIAAAFGVSPAQLAVTRVHRDRLGMTHVWFAQRVDGLAVVGGELVLHVAADGTIRSATGTVREPGAIDPAPSVPGATAVATAVQATADGRVDAGAPALTYVIATGDAAIHLAWEIEVTGRDVLLIDRVFVDAHDGRVVDRHPRVFTAKNRTVFDGHGGTFPFVFDETQIGSEGSPPTDAVALAAYDNTGTTYDCYQELFARDSYDDAGGVLRSLVHITFFTPSGNTGNNAAWTGDQMVYGDGDGVLMDPLALSLDVTAHELTHGVTSATANLAYQNESGALNEGMSDILAAVCEAWKDGAVSADTWLVGEDIFTPGIAGDGLRYMADPNADAALYPPSIGGSRDFYPDRYTGGEDNGGVHLNSGIANLAFQLLVDGGSHPRDKTTFGVPGIGIDQAGAIFQRALTAGYLTMNSTFAQARTATEEVAAELYPGDAELAVGMAWAAVGVGTPPITDTVPPTVAIVSPANGDTVAAGFGVTVDAQDDDRIVRVELSIDGVVVGTDTEAPYDFTTDAGVAPGVHAVAATAYDLFNQATDTISVTVGDAAACSEVCGDGEVCVDGDCVPEGNPGDGESGGCGCASGADRDGGTGSLILIIGAVVLGIRRRRRPSS